MNREVDERKDAMKWILTLFLCAFVTPALAQQKLGTFEYQGLRMGMTRAQVDATLRKYYQPSAIKCGEYGCMAGEALLNARYEYLGDPVIHLSIDRNTGKLTSIDFTDKVHDFDNVSFPFLQRYGQPNRENSETTRIWEVRIPNGCGLKPPKTPCQHFEFLDIRLIEGKTSVAISGQIK